VLLLNYLSDHLVGTRHDSGDAQAPEYRIDIACATGICTAKFGITRSVVMSSPNLHTLPENVLAMGRSCSHIPPIGYDADPDRGGNSGRRTHCRRVIRGCPSGLEVGRGSALCCKPRRRPGDPSPAKLAPQVELGNDHRWSFERDLRCRAYPICATELCSSR
jgi:hypothetical protein